MPNVSLLTSGIGDVNQGGQLVPTGTVLAFAGTSAPSGWLLCDGSAYSQTDYFALFSALGTTYNNQINPTTNAAYPNPTAGTFRVPDYRGIFLRSSGQAFGQTAVSVGGHQGQATAKNGLQNASSSVGVSGATSMGSASSWNVQVTGGGDNSADWGAHVPKRGSNVTGASGNGTYPGQDHTHTFSASGTAAAQTITGDAETRPINKGVMYIIKV